MSQRERGAGRSLALLRPEILEFVVEKKEASEIAEDGERFSTCQDWETKAAFFNWPRQYGSLGRSMRFARSLARNIHALVDW